MEIYCDESGFTGNQMLDAEQPVFTYASVAISPQEAAEHIAYVQRKYKLQGLELKGGKLAKQVRGQQAISELLKRLSGKIMFSVHLKPYALAGKLFEYIFEPAFSKCNSIFYEIDFHRFISTLLFAFFRASNTNTSILLQQFSTFARDGDKSALAAMFPLPGTIDYRSNPLHAIGVFAELHRDQITEEMLGFREPGVPNWILDLTTTSLYHLLVKWGAKFESLEVTCDEAKPLKGDLPLFNAMVGRTEKAKVSFQGREHGILFNLSRPLEFGKSHEIPGLQLADVVAAAAGAVWNASYSAKPNKLLHGWRDLLVGGLADDSIWPDLSVADLSRPEAFANSAVLMELVDRAVAGRDLCEGMFALHRRAMIAHRSFQSLKESIL